MKALRNPKTWIGVVSLTVVLGFAVVDMGKTSPGPLATVHHREPDLSGRSGCNECHGGFRTTMTQACLYCHTEIAAHVEEGRGLHGRLAPEKVERCASCHSDHHGGDFPMVNRSSFAQAGVPNTSEFDHGLVGYDMRGRHLELACAECHANAEADVLPPGQHRFIGLDVDCASCHDDPHEGRMALACADCHSQDSFLEVRFDHHDSILPLEGGHAGLECRVCHEKSGARALEIVSFGTLAPLSPGRRECVDCHESPHRRDLSEGVARLEATTPGSSCVACHESAHESFADETIRVTPERHACSGFPLDAPHAAVECAECHSPAERDFAARYPGRAADDCRSCHADPHGGQFDRNPADRNDCVDCHERHRFEPHAFSTESHAATAFPLDGKHLSAECGACHEKASEDSPRDFDSTPSRCEACHEDAHGGFFEGAALDADALGRGACAPCHVTTSFSELPPHGFDHDLLTGFPLRGAHAEARCVSCHRESPAADRFGRTFGRVHDLHGEVTGCDACHPDPHGGAFDAKGRPREVDGRTGCVRCHGATSFRVIETPFDHGLWTGFPLDGAHGDASCASCHAPLVRADPSGRTLARARGAACADCHDDPHAGQFVENGRIDCRRCHESTTRFADLSFNHNLESRFPLGDTHDVVSCEACHRLFDHKGAAVVRYKPLPTQCVDCHGDNVQPLKRKRDGVKR